MGIKERRDVEKAEMKQKIMTAAIEIIEQEGYEKLSIRKIASRIEYSPTTIISIIRIRRRSSKIWPKSSTAR